MPSVSRLPELKEYEAKILTAEERILEIEKQLFQEIRNQIAGEARRIRESASVIAELDVLANFANIARHYGYSRPQIASSDELTIHKGRHPVIEALAEQHRADRFVPNDLYLNDSSDRIVILTGPNMGGKSTFPQTGRSAGRHGADGILRAGADDEVCARGQNIHANRSLRSPDARAFDLHGRDDGNCHDPQFGDRQKSDRAG